MTTDDMAFLWQFPEVRHEVLSQMNVNWAARWVDEYLPLFKQVMGSEVLLYSFVKVLTSECREILFKFDMRIPPDENWPDEIVKGANGG